MADTRTLKEALEQTYRKRWAGTRSEKTTMSQAELAVGQIAFAVLCEKGGVPYKVAPVDHFRVEQVHEGHVREATAAFYKAGLSPATINKRLNCLSAMGISVEGCRVKNPKKLQWWLRPEVEDRVLAWLEERRFEAADGEAERPYLELDLLVAWTTKTGLRISESLALRRTDFSDDFREVTVPGTKTGSSQATLALGRDATALVSRWFLTDLSRGSERPMFRCTYEQLHEVWQEVRKAFGFTDPTATLKALRRSAARYLHYDRGMPLDMVRQYLRHENIETTMGYLRLTGGVSLDEQRRYLG